MKRILWILLIGVVVGCIIVYLLYGLRPEPQLEQKDEGYHQTTVYLQPYDNFTQKEAERLKAELDKHLGDILDETFRVVVLPNKPLSDSFLGETKTKYRIDKVIADMKGKADKHNIYVGVTHRDICMRNKNGVKDWGVLGCSISSNHACVVSDHRLKHNKSDLWKVATHEFIHTYYAYPHCPKDSSHCLMKDAKGHADFRNKKDLCGFCKNKMSKLLNSKVLE
jgi:hypothetical protein